MSFSLFPELKEMYENLPLMVHVLPEPVCPSLKQEEEKENKAREKGDIKYVKVKEPSTFAAACKRITHM
jgi:hypothetical protein